MQVSISMVSWNKIVRNVVILISSVVMVVGHGGGGGGGLTDAKLGDEGRGLKVGFYSETCPNAESIVRDGVEEAFGRDRHIAPQLLRLFFHDCFVQGCDGSILVDGSGGERDAKANSGLVGFDVIENVKAEVESACPGVVSCADILALAARDAVALSEGPSYDIPTGRRDGRVSTVAGADADLPDADDSIQVLKSKFRVKGLSDKDLLLLTAGGHTIGTTACFFMTNRLYNFSGHGDTDPSINPELLPRLKSTCPSRGDPNQRFELDVGSEFQFDDHILSNIRSGFGVLASDARLNDDGTTKAILDSYLGLLTFLIGPSFSDDFAISIVKLGNVGVKTGSQGEIRRNCHLVN